MYILCIEAKHPMIVCRWYFPLKVGDSELERTVQTEVFWADHPLDARDRVKITVMPVLVTLDPPRTHSIMVDSCGPMTC